MWDDDECTICLEPLLVSSVRRDDIELRCGHHYHKQCLLEHASSLCAECKLDARNPSGKTIVTVHYDSLFVAFTCWRRFTSANERRSVTKDFDFTPELEEEAFHAANPQIRLTEKFLVFVEQGDTDAAEYLLTGNGGAVDPNCTRPGSKQTALHIAAHNDECAHEVLTSVTADCSIAWK